jgi:hypothetical protein
LVKHACAVIDGDRTVHALQERLGLPQGDAFMACGLSGAVVLTVAMDFVIVQEGAGGWIVHFDGFPLAERRLKDR